MLYNILDIIKPEILLQENDSKQIADYTKEIRSESNEQTATLMYLKKYPKTINLPFEFEGRNQYRKDNGMVPIDNLTITLMDSLYQKNMLSANNKMIYEKYVNANKTLYAFARTDIKTLNSLAFETVNRYRQSVRHHELPRISDSEDLFSRKLSLNLTEKKFLIARAINYGVISGISGTIPWLLTS